MNEVVGAVEREVLSIRQREMMRESADFSGQTSAIYKRFCLFFPLSRRDGWTRALYSKECDHRPPVPTRKG